MKNITRTLICNLIFISLSACSLAPGIPGLKTNVSVKPQKEGVDYKLVIIDAETIRKQKPFDYAAYITAEKKRAGLYSEQFRSDDELNVKEQNNQNNKNYKAVSKPYNKKETGPYRPSDVSQKKLFQGVSSSDNKSNYQYYLGKGDILNITVWDHPELTNPSENNAYGGHAIDSDGYFYFPYSGKIKALGKTVKTIRNELENKLGSFITKPQVTVSIAQYRSQQIYTSGAVIQPSTLMITDVPLTVRDAISKSGGLKPNQYTGYATLARNNKNISIDLNRMLKFNDNRQNFILKNGDRLNVIERTELDEFNRKLNLEVKKENTISSVRLRNELRNLSELNPVKLKFALEKEKAIARLKKELARELRSEQGKVFVMGEVHKPGSVKYQLQDGMTMAEAINDAGSFREETVNPKGIFLVRREDAKDKIPTVYQLPIASVHSMFFAEQFKVRPRDIVYVTATPSIRWNRVLNQLLPSLVLINTFK